MASLCGSIKSTESTSLEEHWTNCFHLMPDSPRLSQTVHAYGAPHGLVAFWVSVFAALRVAKKRFGEARHRGSITSILGTLTQKYLPNANLGLDMTLSKHLILRL